ncbi:MAG: radical SAM protein, partial [Bacteroidales bacterium]|nr:radical SAM protein [Bacteroidales bacterium]
VVGLVIGTRPDCIDEEKLDYLASLSSSPCDGRWSSGDALSPHGPVIAIEYGIESCYDGTLRRINRGHDFECARRAVEMTAARGLDVGAHFILGLPGETREMLLDQCSIISELPLTSVKFHQLQIVKGTRMEKEYAAHPEEFLRLGLDDYLDLVIDILERLRPDLYIERVAGEVPPRFVSETPWGLIRNDGILRRLDQRLEERDTHQGRRVILHGGI